MSGAAEWFIGAGGTGAGGAGLAAPWLPRIFCFPHAGGSPRPFLGWQAELGQEAEILAVCRPGREHRAAQPAPAFGELVEGAAAAISVVTEADGRPVYLFGHSLGALVAFEVARRLTGPSTPRHFVASGCAAPSLLPSRRVQEIARLTGQEFAEAIGFFGGLPADVIAEPDLRDLLLPPVIADFRLAVGYRYRAGPRLAVPASLIVGREDPHVSAAAVQPWDDEFSRPPQRHWVDGGHFYFESRPAAAAGLLRSVVSAGQHVELI